MYEKNLAAAIRAFADSYSSEHDMVLALDAAAEALDPRTMARGDTEVAAPRNCSEIPNGSTPRMSWKRWAYIDGGVALGNVSTRNVEGMMRPVTVIEGHIDLAEIEREAYRRGVNEGMGMDLTYGKTSAIPATPQPMCGVEPVVVEAWTHHDHGSIKTYPWTHIDNECGLVVSAWEQSGDDCNTPCTVAIWPGVRGGKKVTE